MPELPEVETIRRQLEPELLGRAVTEAWCFPSSKFTAAPEIVGATFESIGRRGKYLILGLDDDRELIVHLGMTGSLRVVETPDDDGYLRARWRLDDGRTLVFRDVRRFGRIAVVAAGDYSSIATLRQIGPEPFDAAFTAEHLHRELNASTRYIKTQLLTQRPVAGLGNIYADEALWLARVYPRARRISRPAAQRLRDACVEVLTSALGHGGTTLRDYRDATGAAGTNQFHLRCYGRADEPCERCGTTLRSTTLDARTTTWCPSCQRR